MIQYHLYHHKNLALAYYALAGSETLRAAQTAGRLSIQSLPQQATSKDFARLPTALRRLLFFARPDLVICIDDGKKATYPVFAIELTDHVPAQDHWMQRFNHLVGCAQEGVPGAYVLPFSMTKHPKFASSLNHVFFRAYERVTELHQTAIFIAEWEVEDETTTRCDEEFTTLPSRSSSDIRATFNYLETVLDYAKNGRALSGLMQERLIVELRDKLRTRAYAQQPEIKDFKRLAVNMPDNRALNTEEFSRWLNNKGRPMPDDLPERLAKRGKYLVLTPLVDKRGKTDEQLRESFMKRIELKGGDPYLGLPLTFDYLFCRLGRTTYDRDINLVLDLSILSFSDMAFYHRKVWESSPLQHQSISKIEDIPTYTMHLKEGFSQVMKNVLRVYAFAADIIVYRDAVIYF